MNVKTLLLLVLLLPCLALRPEKREKRAAKPAPLHPLLGALFPIAIGTMIATGVTVNRLKKPKPVYVSGAGLAIDATVKKFWPSRGTNKWWALPTCYTQSGINGSDILGDMWFKNPIEHAPKKNQGNFGTVPASNPSSSGSKSVMAKPSQATGTIVKKHLF